VVEGLGNNGVNNVGVDGKGEFISNGKDSSRDEGDAEVSVVGGLSAKVVDSDQDQIEAIGQVDLQAEGNVSKHNLSFDNSSSLAQSVLRSQHVTADFSEDGDSSARSDNVPDGLFGNGGKEVSLELDVARSKNVDNPDGSEVASVGGVPGDTADGGTVDVQDVSGGSSIVTSDGQSLELNGGLSVGRKSGKLGLDKLVKVEGSVEGSVEAARSSASSGDQGLEVSGKGGSASDEDFFLELFRDGNARSIGIHGSRSPGQVSTGNQSVRGELTVDTRVLGEVTNRVTSSQLDVVLGSDTSFGISSVGSEAIKGHSVEVLEEDGKLVNVDDFGQLLASGGSASASGGDEHVADADGLGALDSVGLEGINGADGIGASARFRDVAFSSRGSADLSGGLEGTVGVTAVSTVALFSSFNDRVTADRGRGIIGALARAFKVDVDVSLGNLLAVEDVFNVRSNPVRVVSVRRGHGDPRSTTEFGVLHRGTNTDFKVVAHEELDGHGKSQQSSTTNQGRGFGGVERVVIPVGSQRRGRRVASSSQFVFGGRVDASSLQKESKFEGSILNVVAQGFQNSRDFSSIENTVGVVVEFVEDTVRNTVGLDEIPLGASVAESLV